MAWPVYRGTTNSDRAFPVAPSLGKRIWNHRTE